MTVSDALWVLAQRVRKEARRGLISGARVCVAGVLGTSEDRRGAGAADGGAARLHWRLALLCGIPISQQLAPSDQVCQQKGRGHLRVPNIHLPAQTHQSAPPHQRYIDRDSRSTRAHSSHFPDKSQYPSRLRPTAVCARFFCPNR